MFGNLRTYRIGTLAGFPIEVNLSFLVVPLVALIWAGLSGVLAVIIAFASVILHELGHALTARHLRVPVVGIELHLLGGAAKMTGQPKTANDEVLIAAAGPAVSFALGGVGLVLSALSGAVLGYGITTQLLSAVGWINLVIGVFNLVPALPMDGGRILRALLTRKFQFARATEIAVKIARGFAVIIGVIGLFTLSLWLLILVPFLWLLGSQELHLAQITNHHFTYDKQGYRRYDFADYDVMPPGFGDVGYGYGGGPGADSPWDSGQSFGWPGLGFGRIGRNGPISFAGFVIKRRNGRLVIEQID